MKSHLKKVLISPLLLCILLTGSTLMAEPAGNHLGLDAAIDEAIRNNRLVHEAIEQEQAAVQGEKKVRADLLPKVSTSYTYSHLRHDPYTFFGSRKVI
ncbi:MAG: TolC family protein, partial [Deltaproteobacteria bacterium]|nr:TolC family protein [Deltaproteobacteria bacterium]